MANGNDVELSEAIEQHTSLQLFCDDSARE